MFLRVWEYNSVLGRRFIPSNPGEDPRCTNELTIDKLFCPFLLTVPTKTGLLNPAILLIKFALVRDGKLVKSFFLNNISFYNETAQTKIYNNHRRRS